LFDILDSTKFTLLQFTNGPAIQPPLGPALAAHNIVRSNAQTGDVQTLSTHMGTLMALITSVQPLVLIRPDGYLGATGTIASLSAMARHLRVTFLPAL